MIVFNVFADGPLTNTQIAHTLQLPNDMLGPGPSPALRAPQMNPLRPTQPAPGQVGRAPQTVGSQANHTQVPQLLQQQTGQAGLPGISQHLPTQSQVIVIFVSVWGWWGCSCVVSCIFPGQYVLICALRLNQTWVVGYLVIVRQCDLECCARRVGEFNMKATVIF